MRRRPLLVRTTGKILDGTGAIVAGLTTSSASPLPTFLFLLELLDSESESEELSLLEDVPLVEELDSSLSSSPLILALSLGGVDDSISPPLICC